MEQRDVQAIVNLMTMSVEGLDKSRVSIADTSGKVLFQPNEEDSLQVSASQLEHQRLTQQNLERRIEELLMPLVGPGKVIAKVNADLDYSQRTIRKELFDPDRTVLRSETRSETSTQGRTNLNPGCRKITSGATAWKPAAPPRNPAARKPLQQLLRSTRKNKISWPSWADSPASP